ncbi:MAG: hypothetical protein QF790_04310 [Gammaproteobacteria bacterium]|jgi:hypothetical protein|nr:hypothetical protein [Gammaproteobacteria bacterium]MDP6616371.1 hypothetical protein [Gammaproteobacteria bacterium]MDP6695343.1 hypothetical protein [Gammaproteobacteria bacterium]
MTCGGSMMRTSQNPLAELVDAVAEKWQAVADASPAKQLPVKEEIARSFSTGDLPELTFHGLRFVLTITKQDKRDSRDFFIDVIELKTDLPAG